MFLLLQNCVPIDYLSAEIGQLPRSRFCGSLSMEISKSKISIGTPSVVHTLGMSTIPAIDPLIGAHDSNR